MTKPGVNSNPSNPSNPSKFTNNFINGGKGLPDQVKRRDGIKKLDDTSNSLNNNIRNTTESPTQTRNSLNKITYPTSDNAPVTF